MGYIIKNNDWITKTITIPEAEVLTMGSIAVLLLNGVPGFYFQLNYAVVTAAANNTMQIDGYGEIELYNNSQIAVFEENKGYIALGYYNQLAMNITSNPHLFGSQLKTGKDVTIRFKTDPSNGNGDLEVTLQYKLVPGI